MEFRYRAGEKTEQSRLPLVASFSPPPPLQPPAAAAATIHSRPSLEALQRVLQEERIKEEILVRRLNQRRMIEEQARREFAIRRSLPFHGSSVPAVLQPQPLMILPPPPMFRYAAGAAPPPPLVCKEIDFDSRSLVPLQEEEEEEEQGEEPPMAIRIKKRKADAAGGEGKFPRPSKEWGCALCMVSATNEEGLKSHLKGKKHQARAAAELASSIKKAEGEWKAKKMVVDEQKANEEVIDEEEEEEAEEERKGKKKKKKKKKKARIVIDGRSHLVAERRNHLFCEACDVKCYTKEVMISHLCGKKHQAAVRRQKRT